MAGISKTEVGDSVAVSTIHEDVLWCDGGVRHEALHDRVGVRDLHRLAVVAAG